MWLEGLVLGMAGGWVRLGGVLAFAALSLHCTGSRALPWASRVENSSGWAGLSDSLAQDTPEVTE